MFKFKAKFVKLLGNTIKISEQCNNCYASFSVHVFHCLESAFAEQIFVDPEEEEVCT